MKAAQSRLWAIDSIEETRREVLACVSACSLPKSGSLRLGSSLGAALLSAWALRRLSSRRTARTDVASAAGAPRLILLRLAEVLLPLALTAVRSSLGKKMAGKWPRLDVSNLFFRWLGFGK